MKKLIIPVALAALLWSPEAGARDERLPNPDDLSAVVSVRGLDLATPSGQAQLRDRLERAARGMCARVRVGPDPWALAAYRRCRKEAADGSRAQVEHALLNASRRAGRDRRTALRHR